MGKLNSIQILRALAAILVVIAHTSTAVNYSLFKDSGLHFHDFLGSGVDLFFVISGFVMYYVVHNQPRNPAYAVRFFAHRVVRVMPMYWMYSFLFLIFLALRNTLLGSSALVSGSSYEINLLYVTKSFLLIPTVDSNGNIYPILNVGWTLFFEVCFYAFFAIAFIGRLSSIVPKLCAAFGACFVIASLAKGVTPLCIDLLAHPLVLEFVLGVLVGRFCLARPSKNVPAATSLGLVAIGAGLWIATIFIPVFSIGSSHLGADGHLSLVRAWFYGVPCTLIVGGIILFEQNFGLRFKLMSLVGDASYSIYLSHLLVILVAKNLVRVGFLAKMPGGLSVTLIVFFCTGIGVVLYRFVELPTTAALRRFVDESLFVGRFARITA